VLCHVLPCWQVGVVSFGPFNDDKECGNPNSNLGAYTSIMALRGWIDGQIRALRV